MPTNADAKRRTDEEWKAMITPGGDERLERCAACGHIFDTEDSEPKMTNNPKRGGQKTATRAANH